MTDLGSGISDAIHAASPSLQQRLAHDPGAYLELVALTQRASTETDALLRSSIAAARTAGHSWTAVGEALGISKQAAQQRFGAPAAIAAPGEQRVLSPLTSFTEMEVLERAGRLGWHSIGFGALYHLVEKSDVQWRHERVPAFGSGRRELEAAGWQRVGSMWFPWAYYAVATELAAEDGELSV
jgi:hypothetical protein